MAEKTSFLTWWNTNKTVKLWVGRVYSVGAAVVIVGALFKIMHFPGAGVMLCVGMGVEALLFTLGFFDLPHKEYHWDKVFSQFREEGESTPISGGTIGGGVGSASAPVLKDEDVKNLSEGIQNIADTANKLASLSSVGGSINSLKKTMDEASAETDKFLKSQTDLNQSTQKLSTSYNGIVEDMETVVAQTKNYAENIETVNKNLLSINSVYELELKNIQAQVEAYIAQNEQVKKVTANMGEINSGVEKMKNFVEATMLESKNYKTASEKLTKQITDLNQIYGNMLNALS